MYSANGLTASIDTTDWDKDSTGGDSRYRVSAKYDMGAVAVGAGYEDIKMMTAGVHTKYTVMGVSAPMGALTVGAAVVSKQVTSAAKVSGSTVGVSYALSKRTSVTANTASWKTAGAAADTKTTVLLNHNF
jgi:predicted porin